MENTKATNLEHDNIVDLLHLQKVIQNMLLIHPLSDEDIINLLSTLLNDHLEQKYISQCEVERYGIQ